MPTDSMQSTAVAEGGAALADRLTGVVRCAAELADRAERDRRLDASVARAIVEAGFARHFVPLRWGGAAGGFADMLRAVAALAEHCPSAAWVASIAATLGRMTAYLPVDGQAEVWAGGPDPLIVGALNPAGRAERRGGGWRISGSWPYMSGVDHSDWALLCAVGDHPGDVWFFAVPRREYRIVDAWHNVGLRGTGSHTLVIDELVVPDARSFPRPTLLEGVAPEAAGTCHAVALKAVNGLSLAAPLLGAARGALAGWSVWAAQRMRGGGAPGGSTTSQELAMARAGAEIDAAALLLERIAGIADRGAITTPEALRNARDCSIAVDLLVTAVDRLFRSAGTRGQSEGSAFQRYWRDVNAGSGHVALQFEPAAVAYARHVLQSVAV